jgi:hypothetical protein
VISSTGAQLCRCQCGFLLERSQDSHSLSVIKAFLTTKAAIVVFRAVPIAYQRNVVEDDIGGGDGCKAENESMTLHGCFAILCQLGSSLNIENAMCKKEELFGGELFSTLANRLIPPTRRASDHATMIDKTPQ